MSKRLLRACLAVCASAAIAACSQSSPLRPSTSGAPSQAGAAQSFGELSRAGTSTGDGLSQLTRCLNGSADAACFAGATITESRLVIGNRSPTVAATAPGSTPAAADAAPNPPTNLVAYVFRIGVGSEVDLFWNAPVAGAVPTDYRIEAGSATGLSDLAAFNTGNRSTFFITTVAGSGTFYVRVRAVASGVTGAPSNEVLVTLPNTALPTAPFLSTPQVIGSTVTLTWSIFSSPAVTSYIIQASSRAGGPPDLANFATGNASTSITATGVAPGTYFVRVLGANNAGVGPPSNEVTLIVLGSVACTAAPSPPSNLVSIVNGSTVTLGWSPSSAGSPTSYVIEAGSATGLANLAAADTGNANGTATFTGVGRGTYYVRVRGKNACGTGSASNEIVVTVP